MVFSGINKRVLERLNCRIDCYIDHEEVFTLAKEKGIPIVEGNLAIISQKEEILNIIALF